MKHCERSRKMRYCTKYVYGRYELHDNLTNRVICFSYTDENAEIVCRAMNKLESDTHDNENDIGVLI